MDPQLRDKLKAVLAELPEQELRDLVSELPQVADPKRPDLAFDGFLIGEDLVDGEGDEPGTSKGPLTSYRGGFSTLKFPTEMMIEAVVIYGGNLAAAARAIGCGRRTIQHRARVDAKLRMAIDTAREITIDHAEATLIERMEDDPKLLMFFLRTQGRRRGYGNVLKIDSDVADMTDEELDAIVFGADGA